MRRRFSSLFLFTSGVEVQLIFRLMFLGIRVALALWSQARMSLKLGIFVFRSSGGLLVQRLWRTMFCWAK